MRFVLLHYHIFKNAGSTVEDILDHSFGERFGTLETAAGSGLVSNDDVILYLDERPALRAFSSHQIRYPMPAAPGYLFFDICFLRDPLDRLRSFYDYFRQKPNPADPMSALANSCALGDFVAGMIADHSLFVRNNQVNLLACGGDSDEPNESDLELAVRRMLAASFLGVVDCFEQSAVAGRDALRCAFPELYIARPAVNVSSGMQGTVATRTEALRAACRPEVFEELLRITELDRRLVEVARAEVLRRYSQVSARSPRMRAGSGHDGPPHRAEIGAWDRVRMLRFRRDVVFDHPLFDAAFYLRKYPDVAAAGVHPLLHYFKRGRAERRQPHPVFDPVFYLERNPDVRDAGMDPLVHYILHGAAEDRKPHRLFEPVYYRTTCRASGVEASANPLLHFLNSGADAANPHPLFDCEAYLVAHTEVQGNPLVHYLESGPRLGGGVQILDVAVNGEAQQQPFLRAVASDQIRAR
jgi:hypothetical protein